MTQQAEEQAREEAKCALLAAYNSLKRVLGPDKKEAFFCLLLGQAYHKAGLFPLKYLNELLTQALEKLSSRGRKTISQDVFEAVEKAIETTGIAILFEEAHVKELK